MKPSALIVLMTAMASASLPALANLELAQKNACTACHAVDKKLVADLKTLAAWVLGGAK